MPSENWLRVEELFHAASALGGAERAAFLARECAGDASLRREVESLVESLESERSLFERPALSLGLRVLSGGASPSLAGRSLGHYKVVRMLDGGGMGGEVYLAEDCLLERPVALKFIAGNYAGDEWAREQMMKEARAVARLEHPHICPVYGVEEIDGHHFIVMQYVEGETLAALMHRGRLAPERAAALAGQVASALAFAHARGVIHRDVKPQNIMVTADGEAKVLDFGLAKFVRPQRDAGAEGGDPVQTLHLGDVVGTPAYMSPEQARGEELDFRSDIYSFGVVLYEMLSGRNPFLRETVEETLAAVGADDVPPLPAAGARGALGRVALRCLAKERARRPASGGSLVEEIRALRESEGSAAAAHDRPRFPSVRRHARKLTAAALALLLLLSAGVGYVYQKFSRVHTLAVLPIINQSGDPATYYLSEGFTRSLFDKFSYLPRLKVRLPSVVPPDKGERAEVARLGRELKAEAVLTGRIFRDGRSLLLRLTLLRAEDAALVWEGTYNLEGADTFAVQDEITREVSSHLDLWLVGGALSRRQTDSEEALGLYMRGRYEWSQRKNSGSIERAIGFFEQAVAKDPSFAKAYAGLADCYSLRNNVAYGAAGVQEATEKARYAAHKAVEAGDSLPEAHTSMALFKMQYEWDWAGAEREFKRAAELNPDYAPAHYWYSNLLALLGRFDDSIREAETARGLDPYAPISAHNYARALYYARRYDEAAARFRELAGRYPDYAQFRHMLALTLMQQGNYDEAVATLERLRAENPRYADAALGFAYARTGRPDDAAGILRDIDQLSTPENPMPPLERAVVYIGLGDRDRAFELLEQMYRDKSPGLTYLETDPMYDGLRPDPRFSELARRLNLRP
jgi:serine/threonine protein kinase/tetratricopeptide (TPR) repeat protein